MAEVRSRSLIWWMPAILWGSLIFFLSQQSDLPTEVVQFPDYLLHFSAYVLLAVAVATGFQRGLPFGISGGIAARSWLLASLYGFTDEFHQLFVPGRHASWSDLLADTLGSLCGVLILVVLGRAEVGSDAR